ncbi:NAD-dependent epimerase/dehydratase family protein [Nocardia xishanensis]|uniref:NAD-dependent epimerase/dehydratase family protein n=1 Tax=Nocardia xishanensis TaxID=238964 RepID=UPI00082FA310|nr:NAD-dependent epimerase/dehydratase family protein [Nocardia xishanensis]
MRILVTGANGYLGGAVTARLRRDGHQVVALVRRESVRTPTGTAVRIADLLDPQSLTEAVRDVDAVCHLAGLTRARDSVADPLPYFRVNVGGTVALLDAMARAGIEKLVFASTAAIYATDVQPMTEDVPDAPPHPYAASKQAAELAIAAQAASGRLAAIVLRLSNLVGGADTDDTRILPRLRAVATGASDRLRVYGDGTATRDYLHLEDAARAVAAAVTHLPGLGVCRRYNIGSETGTSVAELVALTSRITGRAIPVEHLPAVQEPPTLVCDSSRAAGELGWRATWDIEAIVREMLADPSAAHPAHDADPARQRAALDQLAAMDHNPFLTDAELAARANLERPT